MSLLRIRSELSLTLEWRMTDFDWVWCDFSVSFTSVCFSVPLTPVLSLSSSSPRPPCLPKAGVGILFYRASKQPYRHHASPAGLALISLQVQRFSPGGRYAIRRPVSRSAGRGQKAKRLLGTFVHHSQSSLGPKQYRVFFHHDSLVSTLFSGEVKWFAWSSCFIPCIHVFLMSIACLFMYFYKTMWFYLSLGQNFLKLMLVAKFKVKFILKRHSHDFTPHDQFTCYAERYYLHCSGFRMFEKNPNPMMSLRLSKLGLGDWRF